MILVENIFNLKLKKKGGGRLNFKRNSGVGIEKSLTTLALYAHVLVQFQAKFS